MQRVWTNPSLQRSVITPKYIESNLSEILKIKMTDTNFSTREIIVFPNMEYDIVFHDSVYGSIKSIRVLITNIYDDQIKVKYIKEKTPRYRDCKKNHNTVNNKNELPMPTCNCILNPADVSKYNGPEIFFIPISNILNIEYVVNKKDKIKNNCNGVKVMLLGISATFIKAIIIRLEFFEDCSDNAVKYVDLQKDSIYDIVYESNGTIYESRAKIINIEEIINDNCCQKNTVVRENTSFNNSVYYDCSCISHKKKDFMKEPPARKVKITIDTSESFTGRFEHIMLDSIRDCTLAEESTNTDADQDVIERVCNCCSNKTEECVQTTCSYLNANGSCSKNDYYTYVYDTDKKAIVDGETVKLTINNNTSEITLDELIKFYIGV